MSINFMPGSDGPGTPEGPPIDVEKTCAKIVEKMKALEPDSDEDLDQMLKDAVAEAGDNVGAVLTMFCDRVGAEIIMQVEGQD